MSANTPTIARGDNRPKTPGLVGLLAAAVMLVVIVPLALRFSQAPAETIAEFAPQVSQEIKKAPNDQAAINGQGKGLGVAGATPTPSPSPTPSASGSVGNGGPGVVDSPTMLQCVETPGYAPRQIADTQSPPCIPYWKGDNGGSTARGVDASTIGVAFWVESGSTEKQLEQDLINFFNNHFEFYGRKLKLIEETPRGGCSTAPSGTDGQRQEADRLYGQGAFIVLDSYYNAGACFVDESARKGMVTITSYPYFTESQMAAYAPYMWSYYASADREFSDTGAYICQRLAGKPAAHANGENVATTPPQPMNQTKRKFGAVVQYDSTTPYAMSLQPLQDALSRCGESLSDVDLEPLQNDNGSYPDGHNPTKFQQVMAKFQSEGITSIVVVGQPFIEQFFSAGADQQQYHPEWIFDSTMWSNDWDAILRLFWPNADQRASQLMGLSWGPRQVAYASSPAQWAISDTDPSFVFPTSNTATATTFVRLSQAYHELLMAAAGIQMAGPKLTAQSFSDGLMRTEFPNPPSWQQEGKVGFPGVHYMTQDAVEWWWGESAPSVYTDEGPFAICYEAHGTRRTAQTFQPGPDDYFTSACDNGSRPP